MFMGVDMSFEKHGKRWNNKEKNLNGGLKLCISLYVSFWQYIQCLVLG